MKKIGFIGLFLALIFSSCDFFNFQEKANSQFANQHMKKAISLIELYKVCYGNSPPTSDRSPFLDYWDSITFKSINYEKLEIGYRLDILKVL